MPSNLIGLESYMELDEQILFGGNYLLQSEATLPRQSKSAGCLQSVVNNCVTLLKWLYAISIITSLFVVCLTCISSFLPNSLPPPSLPPSLPPSRNRRPGCASARRRWSPDWSRTSRARCSSRTPWSSGLPGWRVWSTLCWSPMLEVPSSQRLHASSC